MNIQVQISEEDLVKLVQDKLESLLNCTIAKDEIKIEVKSKQNYKSEWEVAAFRATVNRSAV